MAWPFLSYTISLVRALARLPFAVVPLNLGPAGLLLLYGLILGLSLAGRLPAERRLVVAEWLRPWLTTRLVLGGGGLAAVLVLAWGLSQPDSRLHVAFLDVGQGDAILIQTPRGRQILVDGGLYPSRLNDRLGRQMPFWDRTLDLVVATHPDADHITGLPGVFDRYRVDRLVTDGAPADDNPTYQALLEAAAAGGTGLQPAQAGAVFVVDGVRLAVVHPGATRDPENRNENSVSLHLTYGHFSLLLTGDGESEAERAMVAVGRPLTALVFKAGHHGSRTSSNAFFLAAVRPRYVVVSAGADNRFGHPHPEVLQRATAAGAAVLRTDELGTIELITDGRRLWWRAH